MAAQGLHAWLTLRRALVEAGVSRMQLRSPAARERVDQLPVGQRQGAMEAVAIGREEVERGSQLPEQPAAPQTSRTGAARPRAALAHAARLAPGTVCVRIAKRAAEVVGADALVPVQVCDRARHPQHALLAARAEHRAGAGAAQQLLGVAVEAGVTRECAGVHTRVDREVLADEPACLPLARPRRRGRVPVRKCS